MQATTKINTLLIDFSYTLCFPKTENQITSLLKYYEEQKKANPNTDALEQFILNRELIDFLHTLKDRYTIALFTASQMQTDPYIQKALQPVFEHQFLATELQVRKSDPNAYKIIGNRIGVEPKQMLFVDDSQTNVQAAQTAGLETIRFTNTQEVIAEIKRILEK